MASSNESISDSEDDMICCHICLLRFNESDRKPKFLDCHHYFCLNCIRGFSKGKSMSCPTCRNMTDMTDRQLDGLATNNIVLRLVNIATNRARELVVREKSQQIHLTTSITREKYFSRENSSPCKTKKLWCSVCSKLGTTTCQAQQHVLCDYREVLSQNMVTFGNQVHECCEMWNKAIEDRQRIHQFYDDILNSLRLTQNDLMKRVESNDSNIAMMESRKQAVHELTQSIGSIQNLNEEDTISAVEKTRNALDKLESWSKDGHRNKYVAQKLLKNLLTVEENNVDASFKNSNPAKNSLQSINLLKNLQLSFNGANHPDPSVKATVSLLTYVVLKAAEEQSKNINGNNLNANNYDFSVHKDKEAGGLHPLLQVGNQSSGGGEEEYNGRHNAVARDGQLPYMVASFRDSLLRPAVKPSDEWQVVSKSSSKEVKAISNRNTSVQTKCYFRITINEVMMERIVFQIEPKLAPIMSAKFIEMCTTENGYAKSRIFKAIHNESVMITSRWLLNFDEKLKVFAADRSDIKEQRGSVRFQVKQAIAGIAEVSTEFQVILADRPRHHRCTTVFGQVTEGLCVFDKISEMNLKDNRIMIVECGKC